MAAPQSPFDVRRGFQRSGEPQKVGKEPTITERIAYDYCVKCAEEGKVLTRLDLCLAVGSQNYYGGTGPGILNRLWDKGLIKTEVYQRGVRVQIVESGKWTAMPPCTVPHYLTIKDKPPVPAIHQVRQKDMSQAQWMETTARRLGRDYLDFAVEIQNRGIQDFKAEEESGQ